MKICIVSQTFAPQEEGGAEISARMGAVQLSKRHDVTVLALGKHGDALVPPGETRLSGGIRVVRLPWDNAYLPGPRKPSASILQRAKWHLKTAFGALCLETLSTFLRQEKFDLIYAQNSAYMQPALFQAAEQAGIPICLHLRDYALLCPKTSMFRHNDNCEKQCLDCNILSRRMRTSGANMTVIAVSAALKNRFLRSGVLTQAQWHVMHNTNTSRDCFDETLLHRRSPASPTFTFAYLGAVAEEKGLPELVEAFVSLPDHHGARLIVAGRGRPSEEQRMRKLAETADVEFRGHVPPQEIYRVADAIVVPSRWHEPQSRVLIEAALYGVPVIGTERGGTPEIVRDHGTGWCYDPGQPNALRDILRKSLEFGQQDWWKQRDKLFPGIAGFRGTAEQSDYYTRLETILVAAASKQTVKSVA